MQARFSVFLGLVLLTGFCLFSYRVKTALRKEESPLRSLSIGETMPDIKLSDTSGRLIDLADLTKQNRVVLINFWATWCSPCRIEMPEFEKIYRKHKDAGFTILAINEDDSPEDLDKYLKAKPVSFIVARDSGGEYGKRFGIDAYPTSILVSDGSIVSVTEGVTPYLESIVEARLDGNSSNTVRWHAVSAGPSPSPSPTPK